LGLDCRTCKGNVKVYRGCDADSPIPGKWNIDGWKFQRCPNLMVTRESFEYIQAYNFYKNGFLPNAGGWLDQPAKLLDAFNIIDREAAKMMREEADA